MVSGLPQFKGFLSAGAESEAAARAFRATGPMSQRALTLGAFLPGHRALRPIGGAFIRHGKYRRSISFIIT
jgi:hypothetical protein